MQTRERARARESGRRKLILVALGLAVLLTSSVAFSETRIPPSPYDILRSGGLDTPLLDAVPFCVPDGLAAELDGVLEGAVAGEWDDARKGLAEWTGQQDEVDPTLVVLDSVLRSRAADKRGELLEAEDGLRTVLRQAEIRPLALCPRLELARVLLRLSRDSEAAAQLALVERLLEARTQASPHADEVAFWRAEIVYRRGQSFDAHLAYRHLTKSKSARLALAARLRLTDLSFDSGKVDQVSLEYEALLPRASAFGASTLGWAPRAAEAALDAGDYSRALRWLGSYLEAGADRDARDAAEIRLADIDVLFDDPLSARKRLSAVAGRRRSGPIGALAAIRAIDLGVSADSAEERMVILLNALRDQRDGLRRYSLGVLMAELAHRGDLEGALAVATRLAYERIDPVVTPDYDERLDRLLDSIVARGAEVGGCQDVIRALGGRYGILIERASNVAAFAEVGRCFEEMELPWLAATVYRTISRRFGAGGASTIALPLARSSLAIGEVPLARRVASAALEDPDEHLAEWRAVLAEADYLEGRYDEAAEGLRWVLGAGVPAGERGRLVRLLALTFERRNRISEVDFVAQRVPDWLAESTSEPAARAGFVEAAMLAGHAYRRAGETAKANSLYRTVDEHAPPGALRSSARFWLGLAGGLDSEKGRWGEDPEISLGSPWARYALFEEHLAPLWSTYGESLR